MVVEASCCIGLAWLRRLCGAYLSVVDQRCLPQWRLPFVRCTTPLSPLFCFLAVHCSRVQAVIEPFVCRGVTVEPWCGGPESAEGGCAVWLCMCVWGVCPPPRYGCISLRWGVVKKPIHFSNSIQNVNLRCCMDSLHAGRYSFSVRFISTW